MIGIPSSGLHSNGYSLARKVLLEKARLKIASTHSELGRTLGEELLEPTRIYAKIARKLFSKFRIKGAAHITGGGITGNLPRVLPPGPTRGHRTRQLAGAAGIRSDSKDRRR